MATFGFHKLIWVSFPFILARYGSLLVHSTMPLTNKLDAEEKEARLQAKEEARVKRIYACLDDPTFLEKMRRRFKDDPRAEAFFQPQKRQDPQHATPLANQQGAVQD